MQFGWHTLCACFDRNTIRCERAQAAVTGQAQAEEQAALGRLEHLELAAVHRDRAREAWCRDVGGT